MATTSNKRAPFTYFVDNFQGEYNVDRLKQELLGDQATLINVCPGSESMSNEMLLRNPFSEQARKGGLGKSMIQEESWAFYYAVDTLKKNPLSCTLSEKQWIEAESTMPRIELAEQISTKVEILTKIVDFLYWYDETATTEIFKEAHFNDKNSNKFFRLKEQNEYDKSSDPSFVAENLFDQCTRGRFKQRFNRTRPILIFFDAFDAQYLGEVYTPLRSWLINYLIPYLIVEMGIKVFISGREKVILKPDIIGKGVECLTFLLGPFQSVKAYEYLHKYGLLKLNPPLSQEPLNEIKEDSLLLETICELTEGKPIFLGLFADLIYREIQVEKNVETVSDLIILITDKAGPDNKFKFKRYLINRIHTYQLPSEGLEGEFSDIISYLAIARHGLSAEEFIKFKEYLRVINNQIVTKKITINQVEELEDLSNLEKYFSSADKAKTEKQITQYQAFFKNTFSNKNLSYVKNRGESRLLHDEVQELFIEYSYKLIDNTYANRNVYYKLLSLLYENKLKALGRDNDAYTKNLLEYISYYLSCRIKRLERQAINRFLYEFSYYLDRRPDFCGRLLEKGRRYYIAKREEGLSGEDRHYDDALQFGKDFTLISKVRMREAEYCLTERSDNWDVRIEKVLTEVGLFAFELAEEQKPIYRKAKKISQFANVDSDIVCARTGLDQAALMILKQQVKIDEFGRESLQARILVAEGEMYFWKSEWEEGRKLVKEALQLFYESGDSHGQLWAEHLLGFEAQRRGSFRTALEHHKTTLRATITYFPKAEEISKREEINTKDFGQRYRLRFLNRIINRVNGNYAFYLRYNGKLLDAIKVLRSNLGVAHSIGPREEVRTLANIAQYYGILGRTVEFNAFVKTAEDNLTFFDDPLLPRRLALTKAIRVIKEFGLESQIYKQTQATFSPHNDSLNDGQRDQLLKSLYDLIGVIPSRKKNLELDVPGDLVPTFFETLEKSPEKVTKFVTREIADVYYQIGKIILASGFIPNNNLGIDFWQAAWRAFENAGKSAKISTFLYLEMEANESLYRLSYLYPPFRSQAKKYQAAFMGGYNTIAENEEEYGIYHDLLAKFYITEGDFALEESFNPDFLSPLSLQSPLAFYARALWHGHKHNQERYLLILDVFTQRIQTIVMEAVSRVGVDIDKIFNLLEDVMFKQDIYKEDATFPPYLNLLLRGAKLEINKEIDNKSIHLLKKGIDIMMRKGKFIKAADINECLIRFYKIQLSNSYDFDIQEALLVRYFQQIYSFQGANRTKAALNSIKDLKTTWPVEQYFEINSQERYNSKGCASLAIGEATLLYRSGEFWNIEKFLLGEIPAFIKEMDAVHHQSSPLQKAERMLTAAIKTLVEQITGLENPSEISFLRIVSEGLFKLGELFTFSKVAVGERKDLEVWLTQNLLTSERFAALNSINGKMLYQTFMEQGPDVFCLSCAHLLAKAIGDQHRQAETLQSIASAWYFQGLTDDESIRHEIFDGIFPSVMDLVKTTDEKNINDYDYPLVASKMFLVKGDILFSELFRYSTKASTFDNSIFELREDKWGVLEKIDEGSYNFAYLKAKLHKMMHCYINALSLLSDATKPYENYHFNNLSFEINRRILLIRDRRFVSMLLDDLDSIWNNTSGLKYKTQVREAFEDNIHIHEISLATEKIFDKIV
jgi:hypothetical protein